jgi:excinuclease ABC subunit A
MGAVEVQMRYLPSTWIPCADCRGQRFSEEVLAARVTFGSGDGARSLSIADVFNLPVEEVTPLLAEDGAHRPIERLPDSKQRALRQVLAALNEVGLGYLALGQPSPTLSGGEAQRVKLTRYLGKGAQARAGRSAGGLLLVLDEPSTGLHPADVAGLLQVFARLVREGASLLVVEHNLDVIRAADWVIDLGPGAGPRGGQLVYAGPPPAWLRCVSRSPGRPCAKRPLCSPPRLR